MGTAKKLISDKVIQSLSLKRMEVSYELANDAAFIKLLSICPDVTNLRVQERPYRTDAPSAQKSFYTSFTQSSREHGYTQPPKQFVEWFDLLRDFSRLDTVEIDVSSLTYLYDMDRFIQKVEPSITNMLITMSYAVVRQPMNSIDTTTIARRRAILEMLKIEMPFMRIQDIKYFVHKFERVSNLRVDLWGASYDEDSATETLDLNSITTADTF